MEMIKPGIYEFKTEFCSMLNIPQNQYNRRVKELRAWLANFFNYEMLEGCPLRIHIKEILGEYKPMPRKVGLQDQYTQEKKQDYERFTIEALGTEYKPNSKTKIARDGIKVFGKAKYHHTYAEGVARNFIKEPFDKYGETNDKQVWVWYATYQPASEEVLLRWHSILKEEHMSEEEAACAWYKQEQGEDVSLEKSYYKNALDRARAEFGDILVLVREWRLKN